MNVELVSRAAVGEWDSLLKQEAAREPDARFALLVERQSRFVFRIAYVVLRNVEDAEDIVQDTFFKLFRTGAWKHMDDEKRFLARVAWRLAVSRCRSGVLAWRPFLARLPPERAARKERRLQRSRAERFTV